jgi:hypothetical protein
MANNISVNFALVKIKTEQFVIFEESFNKDEVVNLNTDLSFGLNSVDKVFLITPKYTFENNGKPFMAIQISCFFKIEDSSWESFIKNKKIIFPKDFVSHMAMITIGTSRGILHTKTEGTVFNNYILPFLNLTEMIVDDVPFDI